MNHVRRYIFCVFTRIDVFEYLFIERDEKKIDHLQKGKFFLWGKQEVYPYLREKKRRNDLFSTFFKNLYGREGEKLEVRIVEIRKEEIKIHRT